MSSQISVICQWVHLRRYCRAVWLTFVFIIVHKLVRRDHVQHLDDAALVVLGCGLRREATDSGDANIEVGYLGGARASLHHLQLLASHVHAVESVESWLVCRRWVEILDKRDSLSRSVHKLKNIANIKSNSNSLWTLGYFGP